MSKATWHVGDALTVMRTLPDASVDLVITSPPFLALRSYLPADHPDKASEMGSEATPGEFVDGLMLVVEECRRVLAPHGSLCIELGDTFAGSGSAGGDYKVGGWRSGQPAADGTMKHERVHKVDGWGPFRDEWDGKVQGGGRGWPQAKSLTMIPELVRLTMAYGTNPLTGRETPQWRIRNVIRWVRPNPPVGALGDKFRPATTDMLVACVSSKRFFDLDAVREQLKDPEREAYGYRVTPHMVANPSRGDYGDPVGVPRAGGSNSAGAPPKDYWEIPTQPYKEAHYATWPKALVLKPIKAMCPEKVCVTCGLPSTRSTEKVYDRAEGSHLGDERQDWAVGSGWHEGEWAASAPELLSLASSWSDCGHNQWRRGIVLDPFAGSGTTLEVATGLGRDAIGIDLDSRNLELARRRVGMFLVEA